jgi:Asp-tRNA(Asn)/Glu-tRNA(Gln) amidotransferase A subunit family amidase
LSTADPRKADKLAPAMLAEFQATLDRAERIVRGDVQVCCLMACFPKGAFVPAGFSKDGLPLSLLLVGRPITEAMLYRVHNSTMMQVSVHACGGIFGLSRRVGLRCG